MSLPYAPSNPFTAGDTPISTHGYATGHVGFAFGSKAQECVKSFSMAISVTSVSSDVSVPCASSGRVT